MQKILLLEDDPIVRKLVGAILRPRGYIVLEAATADEALSETPSIDVLITEVVLPGRFSGIQAALELWAMFPDLKVLLISGVPGDLWPEPDSRSLSNFPAGSCSFLAKPFLPEMLRQRIRELLDRPKGKASAPTPGVLALAGANWHW